MLNYEEIAVLDKNAEHLGIPTFTLMENAGKGMVSIIKDRMKLNDCDVSIFCGLGNNGGDGLVAARHLACNFRSRVRVILIGKPNNIRSNIASENFYRLPRNVEVLSIKTTKDATRSDLDIFNDPLIIDAMLGVGITGKLKEPYKTIVKSINKIGIRKQKIPKKKTKQKGSEGGRNTDQLVVSVDVPTGLGTDCALQPDITITFHDSKFGMTKQNSGEIIIHDIGIPYDAAKFVGPGELSYIPKIVANSHKGDHGRLLVVGGGPYTGAPALVGLSAYRTGVDLVHIATPNRIAGIVAGFSPNFIIHPLTNSDHHLMEDDVKDILKIVKQSSATTLVIGPGLGSVAATKQAIRGLISKLPKKIPIVLDADALGAISELKKSDLIQLLKGRAGVLTPHYGEFRSLYSGVLTKSEIKKKGGKELDQLSILSAKYTKLLGPDWSMILKGNIDIISNGDLVKLNRTGNPGMTAGGTGDVLAGITGALLSLGMKPYNAARCSAFINGYSGDLAWEKYRNGLMATDIIEQISKCLKYSLE
jgi:NAD(P)H-hydrate epimerase